MENYEKKYKEVLEKAKALYKASEHMSGCNVIIETLFPELKESKDEKIRKALIEHFKFNVQQLLYDFSNRDVLAWLEKQAERKTPQWMIDFLDDYRRKIGCILDHDEARDVDGKILCIMKWLENQGQVKESAISQHENRTCEENGNSLTSEDAIEREVKEDAGGYPYIDATELYDYENDKPLAKAGDRVKVVFIKDK